jgi:hypothetical protein
MKHALLKQELIKERAKKEAWKPIAKAAILQLDQLQVLPTESELNELEWETLTAEQRLAQWETDLRNVAEKREKQIG